MRRDADLKRRLGQVAALQALKATASRAELAEAQAACTAARAGLSECETALEAGARAMEALLASEALDFDCWRIGRAVLRELATAREVAADEVARREGEEDDRRQAFGRERAREDHSAAMARDLARRLQEKRDEAATLEAAGLAVLRRMGTRR